MKMVRFAVVVAIAMIASATQTRATLLVYEPFAYTSGNLNGQGATNTTGMTGTWTVNVATGTPAQATVHQEGNLSGVNFSSTNGANLFDGTVANLPTTGGYVGSGPHASDPTFNGVTTDHLAYNRALAPSVTATFVHGSTTWFSFVSARAFNANATSPSFSIGAAELTNDRGNTALGEAIGAGGNNQNASGNTNTLAVMPKYWDATLSSPGETTGSFLMRHAEGGNATANSVANWMPWTLGTIGTDAAVPNIIIGKIEWNDGSPDVISVVRFLQTDALTEAAFNAAILAQPMLSSANWTVQAKPDLNQAAFDTISIAGGRYFADEIRIATTFGDVIGLSATPVPTPAAAPAGLALLALAAARRRSA